MISVCAADVDSKSQGGGGSVGGGVFCGRRFEEHFDEDCGCVSPPCAQVCGGGLAAKKSGDGGDCLRRRFPKLLRRRRTRKKGGGNVCGVIA